MVFKFVEYFVQEKTVNEMFVCFKKTITNSNKIYRKTHHSFCTGFPLCHWSILSNVHPSPFIGCRKISVIVHFLGGFRYEIQTTGGFL